MLLSRRRPVIKECSEFVLLLLCDLCVLLFNLLCQIQ